MGLFKYRLISRIGKAGVTPALTRNRDETASQSPAGTPSESERLHLIRRGVRSEARRGSPFLPSDAWQEGSLPMHNLHFAAKSAILAMVAFIAAVLTVVLPAGTAHAEAYQYWGYYTLSGDTWQYAQTGPDQTNPADGSVEGWRFAVAGQDDVRPPRGTVTFSEVCDSTKAVEGKKRVAVVIDYGRKADATDETPKEPAASCAQVPAAATGADVLAAVSTVRSEKQLVCGINDYPKSGCGGAVATPNEQQTAPDDKAKIAIAGKDSQDNAKANPSSNTGTIVGWTVGGVVVLLVIAGLVVAARRRRALSEN